MLPTIEEIAVKTIISIEIDKPLKEAIKKMASSNHRNIVVIEKLPNNHKKFYLLTISDLIDYKLGNVNEDVLLKDLHLSIARVLPRDLNILNVLNEVDSTDKHMVIVENDELIEMLGLEKSLVYFSTSLKSDEVTLNKIMRGKQIQLYEEDEDLLEDVMIEIHQAIEMCNIYSNTMAGTMDTFASIISNNMNIVMNKLTVITIVMAIPNIIFGFYGMNVQLPFPFVWFPSFVAILACVIATVYFFRHNMFK